jgi:hypothetical protein
MALGWTAHLFFPSRIDTIRLPVRVLKYFQPSDGKPFPLFFSGGNVETKEMRTLLSRSKKMSVADRSATLSALLKECGILSHKARNLDEAERLLEKALDRRIKLETAKERGIEPGVHMALSDSSKLEVVTSVGKDGSVRLRGFRGAFNPQFLRVVLPE